MTTKEILIKAVDCRCNECSHSWVALEKEAPETCPLCKSLDWNTVWQTEQLKNNISKLSTFDKERLNREMLKQGFVKSSKSPRKLIGAAIENKR